MGFCDERNDRAFFATPETDREEYEKDVQHNIDFFASLSMEERNSFPGIYAIPAENAIPGDDGYHEKWTGRRQDWGLIHSQLEVFFADRLPV